MCPNPIVLGVIDESDLVYPQPLYAAPTYSMHQRPVYSHYQLTHLESQHEDKWIVDRCIRDLHDDTLKAEVHRYRTLVDEQKRVEARIVELERAFGQVNTAKLGCIRRLEMADGLGRIEEQRGSMIDPEEV